MSRQAQLDLVPPRLSDLDSVPAHPGHTDTSRQAAERVASKLKGLRGVVYQAVKKAGPDGAMAEEIAERFDIWIYTVRPRLTELKQYGLIADCGRRRPNRRGNQEIVYTLTDYVI